MVKLHFTTLPIRETCQCFNVKVKEKYFRCFQYRLQKLFHTCFRCFRQYLQSLIRNEKALFSTHTRTFGQVCTATLILQPQRVKCDSTCSHAMCVKPLCYAKFSYQYLLWRQQMQSKLFCIFAPLLAARHMFVFVDVFLCRRMIDCRLSLFGFNFISYSMINLVVC